jgi:biotin transporter BioY
MDALVFIQPMYLFQVWATYWECYWDIVCLRSNFYDWLLIPITLGFPLILLPLCRNSSVMCSKTTGLAVACNFYLSLIVRSVAHSFHVTLLWRFVKQKGGIDTILHNWGIGLVAQNIFDTTTLAVLNLFSHCVWRQSFVVQTLWCILTDTVKCKIQVLALGFICSLHE